MINQILDYIKYPQSLERLGTCSLCENFNKETLICSQCGCNMRVKVLIPVIKCPIGRWS